MGFVTLSTYMKLNENINEITAKYSELVALFKEFEEILGEKELEGTGLATAIKKLNELIVDWKDIEKLDDVQPDSGVQTPADLPAELMDLPMDGAQPDIQVQDEVQTQEETQTQKETQVQEVQDEEEVQEKKKFRRRK